MTDFPLRVLVVVAAAQQLLFPFFVNPFAAGAQPIRAIEPSQIEPAGYAFSIWAPIYLLAVAYGVWQLTVAGRADGATIRIASLAIALYLGSSLWLWAAKYGPQWATMPVLGIMAVCATWCLFIALEDTSRSGLSWWCVALPFALYAGWTLCATFVNIAEVAPRYGFARFGLSATGYALLSLGVVGVLATSLVWLTSANLPFAGTIVWTLLAIVVAGLQRGADRSVVLSASIAAAIIAIVAVYIQSSLRRSV